jgi:hypothetical protein
MSDMTHPACDLCGLPVEVPDFSLATLTGNKRFCCEGCHGIYQMLHESEILPAGEESRDLQGSVP